MSGYLLCEIDRVGRVGGYTLCARVCVFVCVCVCVCVCTCTAPASVSLLCPSPTSVLGLYAYRGPVTSNTPSLTKRGDVTPISDLGLFACRGPGDRNCKFLWVSACGEFLAKPRWLQRLPHPHCQRLRQAYATPTCHCVENTLVR